MARYRLKKEHYLQDREAKVEPQLHPEGTEIDWAGKPSLHMDPLDTEATERVTERKAEFADRRQKAMKKRGNSVGWTPAYEQHVVRNITREPVPETAPAQAAAGAARRGRKAA